jgi:hypothetical protein
MFSLLLQVQSQTGYKEVIPSIISYLESLTENLDQYFPSLSSEMYEWVRNPFVEFHQIHKIYSVCKKNNWLNYSTIELWR